MYVVEFKHENGGTFYLKEVSFVASLPMANHFFSKSHAAKALRKARKYITVSAYHSAKIERY